MAAYYNEIDPFTAQWLRNLIAAGHIAPGDVDERSITEIKADELRQYTQCHFFAGIGVWSYALRRAGWSDDRPVWTGSCPCQPFSAAGKGEGVKDERHLWPAWFELVGECDPAIIIGEQVASSEVIGKSDGTGKNVWIDIVQADLERASYAVAAFDLPAAGFGAPHIRQRVFFVADRMGYSKCAGLERHCWDGDQGEKPGWINAGSTRSTTSSGGTDRLADNGKEQRHRRRSTDTENREIITNDRLSGSVANADGGNSGAKRKQRGWKHGQQQKDASIDNSSRSPNPTNGMWADPDWLGCRDGKFRPVESGTFPLVNGAAQRVGRLRAYGNAICAEVATGFISAYLDR